MSQEDFLRVFGDSQIEELLDKNFCYNEAEVRKIISYALAQNKTQFKALKHAAMSNLP